VAGRPPPARHGSWLVDQLVRTEKFVIANVSGTPPPRFPAEVRY
jgi:hypothetical protein